MENIKLVAFDLDGTLTQHKTPLDPQNRAALEALAKRYKLLMVGAGGCRRIFNQLQFPIDVIGNYGMQEAVYDPAEKDIRLILDDRVPCDRESVDRRVTALREKHGFFPFAGENVEFHESGCVTIPLLGTKAKAEDKLAFDPDRRRRRSIYDEVKALFPEYTVFVGGSSSFDMAPAPYDKAYALDRYCRRHGLTHDQVAYVGDDYGVGGNDESVYKADFHYLTIDDYRTFPTVVRPLLDG